MVQDWHFFCRCTFFFSSALSDLSRFNPWTLWKTLKKCIRLSSTKTKVSSFLTYPFYHKPKKCKAFEKIKFEGSSRLSRKSQKCPLAKKMKNLKKFRKLRFKLREFWTWNKYIRVDKQDFLHERISDKRVSGGVPPSGKTISHCRIQSHAFGKKAHVWLNHICQKSRSMLPTYTTRLSREKSKHTFESRAPLLCLESAHYSSKGRE